MTTAILSPNFILPGRKNGYHANNNLYIGQQLNVLGYIEQILIVLPACDNFIFYLGAHHSLILQNIKNNVFDKKIEILTCACDQKPIVEMMHHLGIDGTTKKIECGEDVEFLFNIAHEILVKDSKD